VSWRRKLRVETLLRIDRGREFHIRWNGYS